MRANLVDLWIRLHSSYWFVPAIMAMLAMALSQCTLWLDQSVAGQSFGPSGGESLYSPEGARLILSTVAATQMTVTGVVFSITIVALSLASGQFGPRLISNFMRDRGNQFVLGTFIATYVYCLMVLRMVRTAGAEEFVPQISLLVGIALSLASVGVLIYFIDHTAESIQVTNVIASVGDDLDKTIERMCPKPIEDTHREALRVCRPDYWYRRLWTSGATIAAGSTGYIRVVDLDALLAIATRHDLVISVERRTGEFVESGSKIALVCPKERLDEATRELIWSSFIVGKNRTPEQDLLFLVGQLAEVALRALSPAMNDPFTAAACVDRLGASLCKLAGRVIPPSYLCDRTKTLRVVSEPVTFALAVDVAFTEICRWGREYLMVARSLLDAVCRIAPRASRQEDLAALHRLTERVLNSVKEAIWEEADVEDIEARFRVAKKLLEGRIAGGARVARHLPLDMETAAAA